MLDGSSAGRRSRRKVIAGWYRQSDERAEQIRNDPAMLEMIE